jgi:hypothetical protein
MGKEAIEDTVAKKQVDKNWGLRQIGNMSLMVFMLN